MRSLFVDTTYNNIHLILEEDGKILNHRKIKNIIKMSDIFNEAIEQLLQDVKWTLPEIDNLYLATGPGSFTGVRVGVTFAKTLMLLKPELNVYAISSLQFQAGSGDAISYIDAKGGSVYFAVYQDGAVVIPDQILEQNIAVTIANEFEGFESFYDMAEFNYEQNYLALKGSFKKINTTEELEPTYIKKFM
jgi:tRNA threonylcarbamoyladenosine biosynthesis protein TsaB